MAYADFTYYTASFRSANTAVISSDAFDYFANKATMLIDEHTFKRIKTSTDAVKKCCCELAESFYYEEAEKSASGGKISEKVGTWQANYETKASLTSYYNDERAKIIHNWLWQTGLLYRGNGDYDAYQH